MNQKKNTNKSWQKIAKERISKEMDFGMGYYQRQLEKKKGENRLYSIRSLVKNWELKDLEMVYNLLMSRKNTDPDVFSRQCSQIIFPLLGKWGTQKDFNEMCGMLSQVVEKRMSEESSEYGIWK